MNRKYWIIDGNEKSSDLKNQIKKMGATPSWAGKTFIGWYIYNLSEEAIKQIERLGLKVQLERKMGGLM